MHHALLESFWTASFCSVVLVHKQDAGQNFKAIPVFLGACVCGMLFVCFQENVSMIHDMYHDF